MWQVHRHHKNVKLKLTIPLSVKGILVSIRIVLHVHCHNSYTEKNQISLTGTQKITQFPTG
jgi:phage-related protein